MPESNWRPIALKAIALPTELIQLLSYTPDSVLDQSFISIWETKY